MGRIIKHHLRSAVPSHQGIRINGQFFRIEETFHINIPAVPEVPHLPDTPWQPLGRLFMKRSTLAYPFHLTPRNQMLHICNRFPDKSSQTDGTQLDFLRQRTGVLYRGEIHLIKFNQMVEARRHCILTLFFRNMNRPQTVYTGRDIRSL